MSKQEYTNSVTRVPLQGDMRVPLPGDIYAFIDSGKVKFTFLVLEVKEEYVHYYMEDSHLSSEEMLFPLYICLENIADGRYILL